MQAVEPLKRRRRKRKKKKKRITHKILIIATRTKYRHTKLLEIQKNLRLANYKILFKYCLVQRLSHTVHENHRRNGNVFRFL